MRERKYFIVLYKDKEIWLLRIFFLIVKFVIYLKSVFDKNILNNDGIRLFKMKLIR